MNDTELPTLSDLWNVFKANPSAVLITPNIRLANYFQLQYVQYKQSNGEIVFEKPAIYAYDVWIRKLFQEQSTKMRLLTDEQAYVLSERIWKECLEESGQSQMMLFNEVRKAWKLCHEWNIPINKATFLGNDNTELFFQWISRYLKVLKDNHWIEKIMIPAFLSNQSQVYSSAQSIDENLAISRHSAPFILAGFIHIPSHLSHLLTSLSDQSAFIYKKIEPAKIIQKTAFLSEQEAMEAFVQWAKEKQAQNENALIACVIPQLTEKRNKLDRFMQRYFDEATYDISMGTVFSEVPLIAQALSVLDLCQKESSRDDDLILSDLHFILHSRYLGNNAEEQEMQRCAQADAAIYALGNARLSFKSFLNILKKHTIYLAESLENGLHLPLKKKSYPSQWRVVFEQMLEQWNWPGCTALDSAEYQTHQRWFELLEAYEKCDDVVGLIAFSEALKLLKTLSQRVIFQTEKKGVKLYFLGMMEAVGLSFDALWVMDMNAHQLPAALQLNPFIPHQLQRELAMPHADYAREMNDAITWMQYMKTSANDVRLTYLSQQDGLPLKESLFLKDILRANAYEFSIEAGLVSASDHVNALEILQESFYVPFESPITTGKTAFIRDQAWCPFKAFATHRLKALGCDALKPGLSDKSRGILVHSALEYFWQVVQTLQRLKSYSTDALQEQIHQSASQAVEFFFQKNRALSSSVFFENLEIQRLENLLEKWLAWEMERPDFAVVVLEQSMMLTLANLEISLRADRVDAIVDENNNIIYHLLIDYKTGALPSIQEWMNPEITRLENPQLLMYALSDDAIKGLALAQVKPAEPLMKGVVDELLMDDADDTQVINGIKSITWHENRQRWQTTLDALATEYLQGKNEVNPLKETTCDRCDLHGLCRIRERIEKD